MKRLRISAGEDTTTMDDALYTKIQEMVEGPAARFRNLPKAGLGRRFFAKTSAKTSTGELYLYDQIGVDWFGGIGSKDVIAALDSMNGVKNLNVYVNSPGGDVFEAVAIYNLLDRFEADKTIYIDGLAASAASFIPMVGQKIITGAAAMWMIHNPWGVAIGEAGEMRKAADMLDQVRELLVDTYARRTKQAKNDIRQWMDEETWMDATMAKSRGFTDEVATDGAEQVTEDSMAFTLLDSYKNTPPRLRAKASSQRVRLAEAEAYTLRMKTSGPARSSTAPASRGAKKQ